jgi:hypothetical protein
MSCVRGIVGALLAAAVSFTTTGCLKKVLIDGNVRATREGSDAVSTLHDYEVARSVARAGLGTLEGLYKLGPTNEDAMFLLTRSWAGATYGFTEDDYEQAREANDKDTAAYHRARARAGFERAKFFATRLLETKAPGFAASQNNYDNIKKYLADNYRHKDEAVDLLWSSFAWLGLINIGKDDPELVAGLYVGVAIAERSVELDETLEHGMGHVLLGAYHARTAQSELPESKEHFEKALQINKGKFLSTQLNYANRYYCMKQDKENYTKMMNQVLEAGDPIPEARLQNLIAKRRARRYLENPLFQEDCAFSG